MEGEILPKLLQSFLNLHLYFIEKFIELTKCHEDNGPFSIRFIILKRVEKFRMEKEISSKLKMAK